jgi:hypothetical protein
MSCTKFGKYNHLSKNDVFVAPGMKLPSTSTFCLLIILIGCTDKDYHLYPWKIYAFDEGTILTYHSETEIEQFVVLKIVQGQYVDSHSGTCAKGTRSIYEFQAVYLKPLDSADREFTFVATYHDDCGPPPSLVHGEELICSLVGTYRPNAFDALRWYNEFNSLISSYNHFHSRLTIVKRTFLNVMEFDVPNGKRLSKLYFSTRHGFVGYRLKNGAVFELRNP